MANLIPSAHQAAVLDWIRNGRGNLVVEAVAGSGKSSTLVMCAQEIRGRGLFVAFNKHIASYLASKLTGTAMEAKTIHAVGMGAIRYANKRVRVEENKYRSVVRSFEKEVMTNGTLFGRTLSNAELTLIEEQRYPMQLVLKLVDLARVDLLDCESKDFGDQLDALVDHHALDFPYGLEAVVHESVRRAMIVGKGMGDEIDFVDMIWLPVVHNLRPFQFSWVFVDEAQDLSKCQLALVKKCVSPGGRMVFVGDRNQAINGWCGADAASFQNIVDSTNATVLPLSVCYRCPTTVLDLARQIVPQIEAAPGAPEGVVREIRVGNLVSEIREGDLILCRYNAPLLGTCFELIAEGISASVRGRDISKGLCKVIDTVASDLESFSAGFGYALTTWLDNQIEAARRRGGDEDVVSRRIDFLSDQAECIRIVYGKSGAKTADQLKFEIEKLFANERPSVVLSSVHRAKGLEEQRVFILDPARLRSPRAKRDWMLEQEHNLAYVAYTRAQEELVFVG